MRQSSAQKRALGGLAPGSLDVIGVDLAVIWGLTVHGRDIQKAERMGESWLAVAGFLIEDKPGHVEDMPRA
jgi:hypothetical protein